MTCDTDLASVNMASIPGSLLSSVCQVTCAVCTAADTAACEAGVTTFPTGAAFLPSITAFRDTPVHFKKYSENIGIIGGQLKYVSLRIKTSMQHDRNFTSNQEIYDRTCIF